MFVHRRALIGSTGGRSGGRRVGTVRGEKAFATGLSILSLTHPWCFHDIIELQFINKFCFSDVRVDVNLVCQNQHGS